MIGGSLEQFVMVDGTHIWNLAMQKRKVLGRRCTNMHQDKKAGRERTPKELTRHKSPGYHGFGMHPTPHINRSLQQGSPMYLPAHRMHETQKSLCTKQQNRPRAHPKRADATQITRISRFWNAPDPTHQQFPNKVRPCTYPRSRNIPHGVFLIFYLVHPWRKPCELAIRRTVLV